MVQVEQNEVTRDLRVYAPGTATMTTFFPLSASWVCTLVGAPQAVPSSSSGVYGTYIKVLLGIWSPLEIACCGCRVIDETENGRVVEHKADERGRTEGRTMTVGKREVQEKVERVVISRLFAIMSGVERSIAGVPRSNAVGVLNTSLLTIVMMFHKCG